MTNESRKILSGLAAGQPPSVRCAPDLIVGFEGLLEDWQRDLDSYIAGGGSLLRILWAPSGRGKTHLARTLQAEAARRNYLVCQIDAAADHTDDDLSLYRAFCAGLRHPGDFAMDREDSGLKQVLGRVASETFDRAGATEPEVRKRIRSCGDVPVPALADFLPPLISAIDLGEGSRLSADAQDDISVGIQLISGEQVDGTRALGRLRVTYQGPLLRKLRKTPGKRDARLWLETMLRVLPSLGFSGVVWILDEHDESSPVLLDRHIVQLRRFADRLAEGRVPRVFAMYLVLDDFPERIRRAHTAMDQRLRPVLRTSVPRRILASLEQVRGVEPSAFCGQLGHKLYALVRTGVMPADLLAFCRTEATKSTYLGGTDVRRYVQAVAARLQDEYL